MGLGTLLIDFIKDVHDMSAKFRGKNKDQIYNIRFG